MSKKIRCSVCGAKEPYSVSGLSFKGRYICPSCLTGIKNLFAPDFESQMENVAKKVGDAILETIDELQEEDLEVLEELGDEDFEDCEDCPDYDNCSIGGAEKAAANSIAASATSKPETEWKKIENREPEQDILYKPKDIKAFLDKAVIGQDEAKKTLSIAVYNHIKRTKGLLKAQKSNILMIGPSGVGKTLLVTTIAKMVNLPIVIADATSFSQAGYYGDDLENILARLVKAAGSVERAQKGIVCIDEIDKLAKGTHDSVGNEAVQQGLLKMMEGSVVHVPMKENKNRIPVDTSDILFICMGAFPGLADVSKKNIGFNSAATEQKEAIGTEELVKFGMLSEFVGRLPIRVQLEPMTVPMLTRILTEPDGNLISQYEQMCVSEGKTFKIEDEAVKMIAEKALEKKIGARGLRAIVEEVLGDVLFELPSEPDTSGVVLKCEEGKLKVELQKRPRRTEKKEKTS